MGKLVPFDRSRRPSRPQAVNTDRGQILLFTGVRYERSGNPVLRDGNSPARRKRKRG
ncbi:MAG TPA: hypothetical protein VL418_05535 [Devosiaceae bacterium]|nr:hypothetical protein [Devosiaceae bacterium]